MTASKTQTSLTSSQPDNSKTLSDCFQSQDFNQSEKINLQNSINREFLVSWLFLIGSLMFVLDAILENINSISFSSLLHLSASILFTIGSVLFIPKTSKN